MASTAAIFIRFAQTEGTPSLVIAAWRLSFAAIILLPIAWRKQAQEIRRLPGHDLGWSIAAGIFLAIHMGCWVTSLAFTSVASSVALGGTYPLWVAILSLILFGIRPPQNTILGLVIALTGTILIALSDGGVLNVEFTKELIVQFNLDKLLAPAEKADTALLGDMLALISALTGACYFLAGRDIRTRLSTTAYIWLAYTAAMVVLVVTTLVAGIPLFGYSPTIYLWLLLLSIGRQLLGHTPFNCALAYLSATFVSLAILGEPVGSAIFAYFLFDETFTMGQLVGLVLLLSGIGLGILGEQKGL